jgi:hypothetical protein
MTGRVERPAECVRAAVQRVASLLDTGAARSIVAQFEPLDHGLGYVPPADDVASLRAGWLLVASHLSAVALGAPSERRSLPDVLDWMGGDASAIAGMREVVEFDGQLADPMVVYALLPYLLDPMALGTRRSVLTSSDQLSDRISRKRDGVFYTPADVASFMAELTASAALSASRTVLDPAAGSGVFLRAAAEQRNSGLFFGIDISPTAAEFASFVLLTTLGCADFPTPIAAWHAHRMNQLTADTLRLVHESVGVTELALQRRLHQRTQILERLREGATRSEPGEAVIPTVALSTVFPELAGGASEVLTNPPYAALGPRDDLLDLGARFRCLNRPPSSSMNMYPLFVEQAKRFRAPGGRMAAVVPLSLAFGSAPELRALRTDMESWEGRLTLMHFDRTPDALFGDDVKTRNTIVLSAGDLPSGSFTSALMRWTSRTRSEFFAGIRPTPFDCGLENFVPKLGSTEESMLFAKLSAAPTTLADWTTNARGRAGATAGTGILVAPTAYNWLSCVLDYEELRRNGHDANTNYTCIELASCRLRMAAYAVCSSRVAHFLWRVVGDGFHVSRRFVLSLPVPACAASVDRLSELGEQLWRDREPITSVNGGRTSVAFPPRDLALVAGIDAELLHGLGADTAVDMAAWHDELVRVDLDDERRLLAFARRRNA